MESQYDGSFEAWSTAGEGDYTKTVRPPLEDAGPWLFASQIRERLGEDCELDPGLFEEIWTSGLPAAVESRRDRQLPPLTTDRESCTFAELSSVGRWVFTPVDERPGDGRSYDLPTAPGALYVENWLREPLEPSRASTPAETETADSTAHAEVRSGHALYPMNYDRACELLSVSRYSHASEIKAAYRRMVCEYHPDRFGCANEKVHAVATQQMAAINEAYRLLREYGSAAV
jgi:hypothetical protein